MSNTQDIQLPERISLFCEWFDDKRNIWNGTHVASMNTVSEFWHVMDIVYGLADEEFDEELPIMHRSQFSHEEDLEYFKAILSEANKQGSDIWSKNTSDISINNYNNKQYIWTFGKSSYIKGNTFDSTLFIKRNVKNRAINSMTINLTNAVSHVNASNGLCPLDKSFSKGYIPIMILKFISGELNNIGVDAIMFQKTVVAGNVKSIGNRMRKADNLSLGYRLRVITNKNKPIGGYSNNMKLVQKYMESFHNEPDCDPRLSSCVVKITQC